MSLNAQEVYRQSVRQLPEQERLRLAALILDEITGDMSDTEQTQQTPPPLNAKQRARALRELMEHAGAVASGNPRAADNEQIDADLAAEYGKDL